MEARYSMRERERGVTLVIAALFLAVLTLLAVSAVNTSTVNLRVVSNMQAQLEAEAVAQATIEEMLSTMDTFTSPGESSTTVGDFTVTRLEPVCLDARPAEGSTERPDPVVKEKTEWELRVEVLDNRTGARAVIREGVGLTMLAGNCPE